MKKIVCIFLAMILILSSSAVAFSEDNTNIIPKSNAVRFTEADYSVSFEVTYVWPDCYAAVISVENLSEWNIENWELVFDLSAEITNIANAMIKGASSSKLILESNAYTQVIPASGMIQIGVLVSGADENVPQNFDLYGTFMESVVAKAKINGVEYHDSDHGFYVINEKIDSLTGTFTDMDYVSDCEYVIEDKYGTVLSQGAVDCGTGWAIQNIGLGIGYNHIKITGKNEGIRIYASFDVVNFCLENIYSLDIDLKTDSDNDGICDYFEITLGIDPNNARSICKEKTDYEALVGTLFGQKNSNVKTENQLLANGQGAVNETPSVEGNDRSIPDIIIYRSPKGEGRKDPLSWYSQVVSDDLTFNDYTYNELCSLGTLFAFANITPEVAMWGELATLFSLAKAPGLSMNAVLDDMVDTFRYGNPYNVSTSVESGDNYTSSKYIKYSNSTLTNTVNSQSVTADYVSLIKSYVEGYLSTGAIPENLSHVIGSSNNLIENYTVGAVLPYYNVPASLAISIHSWHGLTITLQNYTATANSFMGTLKFHFFDHFGLDYDDEQNLPGFCDWFALQHYTRFDGLYIPFLTYCDIYVPIVGMIG